MINYADILLACIDMTVGEVDQEARIRQIGQGGDW